MASSPAAAADADTGAAFGRQQAWLHTVKQSIASLHRTTRFRALIPSTQRFFKAPLSLRPNANDDPYEPILFQFGLWHGGCTYFDGFNDTAPAAASSSLLFKLQAAKELCGQKKYNIFQELVAKLMESDGKLRACYEHCTVNSLKEVDKESAAYAIALDVATVYVASRKKFGFHPHCVRSIARSDAILLDNQLPIFAFRCLLQVLHRSEHVDVRPLIEVYAYRNSPFQMGWSYKEPDSDDESLLGCIYDGWVGKSKRETLPPSRLDVRLQAMITDQYLRSNVQYCGASPASSSRSPNPIAMDSPPSDLLQTDLPHLQFRVSRFQPNNSTAISDAKHASPVRFLHQYSDAYDAPDRPLRWSSGSFEFPYQLDALVDVVENNDNYLYGPPTPTSTSAPDTTPLDSACLLSAAHLYRRGIRFRAEENPPPNGSWNLRSCITFDDDTGTITMPKITVVHGTQRFLLNLLAYEHTSRFSDACTLLSYVCFMDMLINSEEDVELLVECGTVKNGLGSHAQLAAMWNGLTAGYPFRLSYEHEKVVERVNAMSRRRWRRWRYGFLDTYFERRPWLVVPAIAAAALLILSFLQTYYTIRR